VPCDDDSNCLLGRCLDTGVGGRFCTITCGVAERSPAVGCEGISQPIVDIGLRYRLECDESAGGGVDGGLCVPRYEIGSACTTPDSEALVCAEGLDCTTFGAADRRYCTRFCATHEECNLDGRSARNYCATGIGQCYPQVGAGIACSENAACLSGNCVTGYCT
jgi:hypothetical protein